MSVRTFGVLHSQTRDKRQAGCLSSMRRDVAVAAIAAMSRLSTLALMVFLDGVSADYDTSAVLKAAPGVGSDGHRLRASLDARLMHPAV